MLKEDLKAYFQQASFNEQSTQVYLINPQEKVLLFRRGRGMGIGIISAPGGKREAGEDARAGARRELAEETGFHVSPENLEFMGKLYVHLKDENYWVEGDIFRARKWTGQLKPASQEGEALWTPLSSLPWKQMWGDERLWLPAGLGGATFCAYVITEKGKIAEHFLELSQP